MRRLGDAPLVYLEDPDTYPPDLRALLEGAQRSLEDYFQPESDLISGRRSDIEASLHINPYANFFLNFVERDILPLTQDLTIRALHYCRLLDFEVRQMQERGIALSSHDSFNSKLGELASRSVLDARKIEHIRLRTPLNDAIQQRARSGKFWMVSSPLPPQHHGVELLLKYWGGEVVYFWIKDDTVLETLANLGRPRILEIALPISATKHAYGTARAMVENDYAKRRGETLSSGFDLYSVYELPPESLICVHTEGDKSFTDIGLWQLASSSKATSK